jgi:asparagine synthase (glutamine-hydrolysing)
MLARDFFGIKPLHFLQSADRFAFASEMKALLRLDGVDRSLNARATFEFLRHGLTDHDGSTLIAGINQLEPGCWMEVRLDKPGTARQGRYWKLERTPVNLTFDDAAAHLRAIFLRNVDRHLRSDVQIGTALSGGIDSSAIVSAVRHLQPDVDLHTFSYIAADEQLTEERWVDIVVEHTGATVHKIRLCAEDMIDDLESLIDAQDQPFSSTSIYAQFCVFRAARDAGVKVMLDGQGADELLGGYSNFLGARLASLVARGRIIAATRFLGRSSQDLGMRNLLVTAGPYLLPESLQKPLRGLVGRELVPGWLNRNWFKANGENLAPATSRKFSKSIYFDELERATNISLPHLLRYEDRNSMYFSIESRVPFLTSELAKFVISVPDEFSLAPDGTRKALFRKAMRGIVPDSILDRRDKIGFATPEKNWLSDLDPWIDSVLRGARKLGPCPIELDGLEQEWLSVKAGRKRFDNHIWRCVNLFVWAERHGVQMLEA